MLVDFLASVLYIAFDHQTFYHFFNVRRILTVVHNFFGDTNLFIIFFSGIGMVGINDSGRIDHIHFVIFSDQAHDVLVVVILCGIAMFADCTS